MKVKDSLLTLHLVMKHKTVQSPGRSIDIRQWNVVKQLTKSLLSISWQKAVSLLRRETVIG